MHILYSSLPTDRPKPQITVKLTYNDSRPTPRPPSPLKPHVSAQTTLRPKAKVNSSATPASAIRKTASTTSSGYNNPNRSPAVSGSGYGSASGTSASTTPRSLSPAKPAPRIRNGALSPTFQPKTRAIVGRSILRPQTAQPTSGTVESRHRSQTTTSTDTGRSNDSRARNGSFSLHHAISFSSLQPSNVSSRSGSPMLPADPIAFSDHEGSSSSQIGLRIKSKVSGMARQTSDSVSSSPTLPSHPLTRPVTSRTRAPSISSSISLQSTSPPAPYTFYPITTATPAANPHRFATTRPSPPSTHHYYQPFSQPHDDLHVNYTRHNTVAKVDPTTIPLPAHSPPASAVSFSSRSSMSRSSVSHAAESTDSHSSVPINQTGVLGHRFAPDVRAVPDYNEINSRENSYSGDSGQDRETDGEAGDEERKVKAEAKSIRKVPKPNRPLVSAFLT